MSSLRSQRAISQVGWVSTLLCSILNCWVKTQPTLSPFSAIKTFEMFRSLSLATPKDDFDTIVD